MSSRCGRAPLQSRHGCGLMVVWNHHPPADPMKVPQTAAGGFCPRFQTHVGRRKTRARLMLRTSIEREAFASCMCMCYIFNMLWTRMPGNSQKYFHLSEESTALLVFIPVFVPLEYEHWLKMFVELGWVRVAKSFQWEWKWIKCDFLSPDSERQMFVFCAGVFGRYQKHLMNHFTDFNQTFRK